MTGNITLLIIVGVVMFAVLGGVTLIAHIYSLNGIKSRTVGDGQHGTARWANRSEIRKTYKHVPFTPEQWREQAKESKPPGNAGWPAASPGHCSGLHREYHRYGGYRRRPCPNDRRRRRW